MDVAQRKEITSEVLERQAFYDQNGRMMRVCKRPLHTVSYYALQSVAFRRPFRVRRRTLWGDYINYYLPECGSIYKNGFFEANLVNFFVNVLDEGDTFLDIGAHVGYYSMLASSLVGESGRVISFEPTPRTFALLSQNTASKRNVTIHNVAVFDEEKEIEFYDYGPAFAALNSTTCRTSDQIPFRLNGTKLSVKTVAIDAVCELEGIEPTVVKVDAEGAERKVLEGMPRTLAATRPLITLEVGAGEEWRDETLGAFDFLLARGYECFVISASGSLVWHTPRIEGHMENLLFVHSTKCSRIGNLISCD
jgi:FkbM family methyltransferase